jgi:hypothetical protein
MWAGDRVKLGGANVRPSGEDRLVGSANRIRTENSSHPFIRSKNQKMRVYVCFALPPVAEMGLGSGRRRGQWKLLNRDALNVVRIQRPLVQAAQKRALDPPKIPTRSPADRPGKAKVAA